MVNYGEHAPLGQVEVGFAKPSVIEAVERYGQVKRDERAKTETARQYIETIFIGNIDEHPPRATEELRELAMKNARRLKNKLLGRNPFRESQMQIFHEVQIASTLYGMGLVPLNKNPSSVARELVEASRIYPIRLGRKRGILTMMEVGVGKCTPEQVGLHYMVSSNEYKHW